MVESLDPASLSICEDRSCHASDALVGADGFDPVDDWLCAASSVFKVAGDICEAALNPAPARNLSRPGSRSRTDRPR